MRTIHSPINFIPEDYEILDYLDKQQPSVNEFFPIIGDPEASASYYKAIVAQWNEDWAKYFGWVDDGKKYANIPASCTHCGNKRIRYCAIAQHISTGENIVFGSACAHRLSMTTCEFKLKKLKEVAAKRNATRKAGGKYAGMLELNPELKAAFDWHIENDFRNSFVEDVRYRAQKNGALSDKQIAAVIQAVRRDKSRAEERKVQDAEKPRANVIEGRREITGTVLGLKDVETAYGPQTKMIVEQGDGAKVYGSVPKAIWSVKKGAQVNLVATVTRSQDDSKFGFFSRPTKASFA